MTREEELNKIIKDCQKELHEIFLGSLILKNQNMVGKYYKFWHDDSRQNTEYIRIDFVKEYRTFGKRFLVYDYGGVEIGENAEDIPVFEYYNEISKKEWDNEFSKIEELL
jgi:hypothetical protein